MQWIIQSKDLSKNKQHSCEKVETSEKVKKLVNEAGVDISDSNIIIAHSIGPKKDKKRAVIVKFTTFRHCN